MRYVVFFVVTLMFTCPVSSSSLDQLEMVLMEPIPTVGEHELHSPELVREAYQANNYTLIWQNSAAIVQLLNEIQNSWQEGLMPTDYRINTLYQLSVQTNNRTNVEFDLLLTDAVMTFATHLIRGKVNPQSLSQTWNYQLSSVSPKKATAQLLHHVKNATIPEGLAQIKPTLPQYQKLKELLIFFKNRVDTFADIRLQNKVLKRNQQDPAVPLIRARLADYRLIDPIASEDLTYSDDLVVGIKKLQEFSQLHPDGIIGKDTLNVLNTSPQERINTIKANLERIRWVENSLDDEYLIVNIAGYELYLYRDGKPAWRTNVVVGRQYSKTPVFKAQMHYIVVNPTWTVPRSIARGMIPKIQKDSQYLSEKNFMVVDSRRNPIDENTIDWSQVNRRAFPYWFVQRPSEANALGQIKFVLPNKYSIYLHDTPAKALFSREQRAFSHGCVRVENPFQLAETILNDNVKWSQAALQEIKDTGETTRVDLNDPLDVFLMYWTVSFNRDGLHFYPDVYGRDKSLINKLMQPI